MKRTSACIGWWALAALSLATAALAEDRAGSGYQPRLTDREVEDLLKGTPLDARDPWYCEKTYEICLVVDCRGVDAKHDRHGCRVDCMTRMQECQYGDRR